MKSRTLERRAKPVTLPSDVLLLDPQDVERYFKTHRGLAKIVPAMCRRARREFGKEGELTLQVYHDPEIDDHYLILYVRLPRYDGDARARIDGVWEHFERQLCDLSGWIILSTDFRKVDGHGV